MVMTAFVLLPLDLFLYNETSWSNITALITAHPRMKFQVIVVPDLANVFSDRNYKVALDGLNNFTNVNLGYVSINWIHRDINNVLADISCYTAWSQHTNPNVIDQGIFFDDTTSALDEETWVYMSNTTMFAKDALGPCRQYISFNPGAAVDRAFYDLAHKTNDFENEWLAFYISVLTFNTLRSAGKVNIPRS